MPKFEKYDLVRVAKTHDKESMAFQGAIGIVIDIDENHEYPYELIFVGKKLNEESEKSGNMLWKDYQLEAI